ncbi:MAG: class I SAM-dependent methyltransferase [Candidatus Aminicenantes bacterium]|nr:class I SAM-dependent methyltransferase [Candidatus Aminicenantes bacterium]
MNEFFYEIFEVLPRQGPGNRAATKKAFEAIKGLPPKPKMLDIGCGTGTQTFDLAGLTDGDITALDNHPPFIDILNRQAGPAGLAHRIHGVVGNMSAPDFKPESFDLIWAEGSVFIIGFENGLRTWRPLLKPEGYMALSDLVWLKDDPPEKVKNFIRSDTPGVKFTEDLLVDAERQGYRKVDYFFLPDQAWWEDYYEPMIQAIPVMRKKYPEDQNIQKFLDSLELEIEMFRDYSDYYGYVFIILQKDG